MLIGNRIAELRKKSGINQKKLAEITNSSSTMISMIETNNSKPTLELLEKLSKYFNVTTDYLITGKENTTEISEEERDVLNAMREDSAFKQVAIEAAKLKKKVINCFKIYEEQFNTANA